ncbi:coproporphyrinogen III oxidase, partial [Campylobacter jejuni]|nr:coproporphyrinogen III oxidase [Campylobacter jejuni]EIP0176558.1 coproporphyrinogen III oxidase [Campylobacter jejuni]
TLNCNLEKELFIELLGLKTSGAIIKDQNALIATEFGQYLFVVLMKDFYTGMDLVRAVFRDDKRLKNKDYIDIMKENIDPLNSASMEFKAETN